MNVKIRNGKTEITLLKSNVSRILDAKYLVQSIARNEGLEESEELNACAVKLQAICQKYGAAHLDEKGELKVSEREKAALE